MNGRRHERRHTSPSRAGWLLFVVLIAFTLSIGTTVHNHGPFGFDGGAEKVSQSKFTCPACVVGGKPVTFVTAAIVVCDSGHVTDVAFDGASFENVLGGTSSSRAPPVV